jgi:hypothetical protein
MNPQPFRHHGRHDHHPRIFGARLRQQTVAIAALLTALPSLALTCEELRSEVEAKIRSSGVAQFTISVADTDAAVPGKVVGSCEMGSKKLLYTVAPPADQAGVARANPSAKADVIITECKDGSVSTGGNCGK